MTEYVIVLPIRWTDGVKTRYCDSNVLVVHKDRPAWQKGRINLVGGKVEPGETPEQAAYRELFEESGLHMMSETDPDWGGPAVCGRIVGNDCIIHCVNCNVAIGPDTKLRPRDGETEKVEWKQFWQIKDDPRLMPNLKVIIPLLFMDSRGWTITDRHSSLGSPTHEIRVALDIGEPFVNG